MGSSAELKCKSYSKIKTFKMMTAEYGFRKHEVLCECTGCSLMKLSLIEPKVLKCLRTACPSWVPIPCAMPGNGWVKEQSLHALLPDATGAGPGLRCARIIAVSEWNWIYSIPVLVISLLSNMNRGEAEVLGCLSQLKFDWKLLKQMSL